MIGFKKFFKHKKSKDQTLLFLIGVVISDLNLIFYNLRVSSLPNLGLTNALKLPPAFGSVIQKMCKIVIFL